MGDLLHCSLCNTLLLSVLHQGCLNAVQQDVLGAALRLVVAVWYGRKMGEITTACKSKQEVEKTGLS